MSGLPAHEAIRNLLGRYCELIDAGDLDGVAELFTSAVLRDDAGNELGRGCEGAARLYAGTRLHADGTPRTRHITANSIIDVDEDAGTATARSAYVVFQATDTLALQPIITGRYRDGFEAVIDEHFEPLEAVTSTKQACALLGASRATRYRRRRPPVAGPPAPRPTPPNALSEAERQHVLAVLRSEEYCDLAPAQVWARLLVHDLVSPAHGL